LRLAVTAVHRLHGREALLDHPGLGRFGRIPLRNLVERRLRSPAEAANSRSGEYHGVNEK
jgi:hypothetical protein